MTIEGRPQHWTPPSEEEQAASRDRIGAYRRKREVAAERSAPVRRRLLETGPPLRDVDAALACHDSCHPTVDVTDHHQGGTTCTCQQSEEERAEHRRRFFEDRPRIDLGTRWQEQRADADRVAAELGVEVEQIGGLAPQITATVDGRSFSLRARHEVFSLVLAPEHDPGLFTGGDSCWGVGEIEIATGDEDELGSWAEALAFCVRRVRDHLRQRGCDHVLASESGATTFRFCPRRGARVGPDGAP